MSSGSWRSKTWLIVYFELFVCGPDKFILSVKFLFQLVEKGLFMRVLFCSLLLSIIFYPM